jgi:N-methylhydantoinase A
MDQADGWVDCPIFDRSSLAANDSLVGPAIIEDKGSSFVLRTGHRLTVDTFGNIFVVVPRAVMKRAAAA